MGAYVLNEYPEWDPKSLNKFLSRKEIILLETDDEQNTLFPPVVEILSIITFFFCLFYFQFTQNCSTQHEKSSSLRYQSLSNEGRRESPAPKEDRLTVFYATLTPFSAVFMSFTVAHVHVGAFHPPPRREKAACMGQAPLTCVYNPEMLFLKI